MTASHDKVVTLYTLRAGGDGDGAGGVGGTGYEQVGRVNARPEVFFWGEGNEDIGPQYLRLFLPPEE